MTMMVIRTLLLEAKRDNENIDDDSDGYDGHPASDDYGDDMVVRMHWYRDTSGCG